MIVEPDPFAAPVTFALAVTVQLYNVPATLDVKVRLVAAPLQIVFCVTGEITGALVTLIVDVAEEKHDDALMTLA